MEDPQEREDGKLLRELVSYGQRRGVKELLAKGISREALNRQNGFGNSAILTAAERNDTQMVRILLAAGANPLTQDFLGYTPLTYAREYNNPEMAEMLQHGYSGKGES